MPIAARRCKQTLPTSSCVRCWRAPYPIPPIPRLTGALHVYGGDFFGVPRSEWDAETLREQQCDGAKMARRFDEANALLLKG